MSEKNKKTKKVEVLKEEVESQVGKADEYLAGWQRCQADFENYKKMQSEAQKDIVRYASQNIIMQLIPVLDNFNSSLEHVPADQQESGWVTGLTYIQKQLEGVLFENGVSMVDVKEGDSFDPAKCEAIEDKECVSREEKKEFKNIVKKIVQRGYLMGERVIRPARVVVE